MHSDGMRTGSTVIALAVVAVVVALARLQEAITTMVALINHVDFTRFLVQKHVKVVINQFKVL
jgi:hypothetical protein